MTSPCSRPTTASAGTPTPIGWTSAAPITEVDSGFIVHNDRTYPLLRRLFAELDVEVHPTEMSMSIHCDGCGLEYAGGRGATGIFAQRRRIADPRFLRLLTSIKRFQRLALALLENGESADDPQTYGDFLRRHGFSDHFVAHYAIPVVSCVWSSGQEFGPRLPGSLPVRVPRSTTAFCRSRAPRSGSRSAVGPSRTSGRSPRPSATSGRRHPSAPSPASPTGWSCSTRTAPCTEPTPS